MDMECCVPSCNNTAKDAILHYIPYDDKLLYNAWLRRIQNPDLFNLHPLEVHVKYRVCSMHFVDHCKYVSKHECTALKARALPTIDMPGFNGHPLTRNNYFMPCVIHSAAVSSFAGANGIPDLLTPKSKGPMPEKRHCTESLLQPVKKRAKTGAERTRDHRARKRALQAGIILDGIIKTVTDNKPAKTAAQRVQEYRARTKALKIAASQNYFISSKLSSGNSSPNAKRQRSLWQNMLTNNVNQAIAREKRAKAAAQRRRESRARKALKTSRKQSLSAPQERSRK